MTATTIDLIRHGEPEGGRAIRGHGIDDPLSEKGWRQMWNAVGDSGPWEHIVTSPMKRCHAFADSLAQRLDVSVSVEPDLKEVGFGTWEGRTQTEIEASNPDEFAAFYRDPVNFRPVGAEPLDEFVRRVAAAYDRVVEGFAGEHLLIVCHAGVIRAIVTNLLQAELHSMYKLKIDNAGITRFKHDDHQVMLMFHNQPKLDANYRA